MNIKSISIHNMHNVEDKTYDFDDVNYIVGHNGAGKSTILQSIQLALLGYIPGYARTNQTIMKHACGNLMTVKLVFSDDNYISRTYMKTKSSVSTSMESSISDNEEDIAKIFGDLELPIFNFSKFLSLSANEQKKWFIDYLPNDDTELNWLELFTDATKDVPECTNEILTEVVDGVTEDMNNDPQAVHEYIKQLVSLYKSEVNSKKSSVAELNYYEDINTDDEEEIKDKIKSLEEEVADLNYQVKNASEIESIQAQLREIDATHKDGVPDLDAEIQKLNDAQQAYLNKNEELADLHEQTEKCLNDLQSYRVENHQTDPSTVGDHCMYMPEITCKELKKYRADLNEKYKQYQTELKEREDSYEESKSEYQKLESEVNMLLDAFKEQEDMVSDIQDAAKQRDNLVDMLNSKNVSDDFSLDSAKDEITSKTTELDDYRQKDAKIQANKMYSNMMSDIADALTEAENKLVVCEALKKFTDPNHLQADLAESRFVEFNKALSGYIQNMFGDDSVSSYVVTINKSNSFEFGIIRDDMKIPFETLSSGEQCMYMLAFQTAILELSDNTILDVIIVDDAFDHLDEVNINTLTDALSNTQDQYIIAGVQKIKSDKINIIEVK